MSPETRPPRFIALEGCFNFRDLGGYPGGPGHRLRRGRLFRSDALNHMTDADVRTVRDLLGVGMVVDLRSSTEVERDGVGLLPVPPVGYRHLPLFEDPGGDGVAGELPQDLADQYLHILRTAKKPIAMVLEVLARSPAPAVFHCAAGKDRTGVISALLLGLLGVPDQHIIEDYTASSRNLDRIIARLRETPSYRDIFRRLPPSTLHARPSTMHTLLSGVRREYGSFRGYARAAGIDDAALATLERGLLEGL